MTGASKLMMLDGQRIEYRLRRTSRARKLRIRVGPSGVEVICPSQKRAADAERFMRENSAWLKKELERISRLGKLRRHENNGGDIFLRGEATSIEVQAATRGARSNKVLPNAQRLTLVPGTRSRTPLARSLENWLRKEARAVIQLHITELTSQLKVGVNKLFIMEQRTKWGNCSAKQNLSFNWRIVMAPDFVTRYLVTHEVVHLLVPDHSPKFWLKVQSICADAERARGWLSANASKLTIDLSALVATHRRR